MTEVPQGGTHPIVEDLIAEPSGAEAHASVDDES